MNSRFPLFVDLHGKHCLVVGAGPVALRRARVLLDFGASLTVVAPAMLADFDALAAAGARLEKRPFTPADLSGIFLCVVATNDMALNAHIASLCAETHVWANVASDAHLGDFHFPAVVRRSFGTVAIHADGRPTLAKRLRDWLQKFLPHSEENL